MWIMVIIFRWFWTNLASCLSVASLLHRNIAVAMVIVIMSVKVTWSY